MNRGSEENNDNNEELVIMNKIETVLAIQYMYWDEN